ncbi:hypothetical protein JCGZ_18170 [Jatropha curcas]|uniref:Uncharacterized protein n=1 Tax=Jatropha curcas TaxID=180498 RepID=A0A067K5N9_JATCU|nr:hypothetical protein JCGZ_18170 [Jatropha curcas]
MALTATMLPPLVAASSSLCHRRSLRRRNDRTKEASRSVLVLHVENTINDGDALEIEEQSCRRRRLQFASLKVRSERGKAGKQTSDSREVDRHLPCVGWWLETG